MAVATYGIISVYESYTKAQLATVFNRSEEWVHNTFIRPVDHKTKARLRSEDGSPMPGVRHFRAGAQYMIRGADLDAWMAEHAERCEEE